jgi:hypothetical protein
MTLRFFLAALAFAVPTTLSAAAEIVVHRDPGCGCCAKWASQLRQQFGRSVRMVDDSNRAAFKTSHGVPANLSSCHTAVIDGYVFEGHVPFADIKKMLAERPKGVVGLAVTGMPLGSPGMEVPGGKVQSFQVIAFGPGGQRLYARHGS